MADSTPLVIDEAVAQLLNQTLRLQSFFPEFGPEHARKLFARSGFFAYPRGSLIMRQGEIGRDIYIVFSGRVGVFKENGGAAPLLLAMLGVGAVIGEIALLKELPRTATVTTIEDCRLFRLVHPDIQYILAHNAELSAHLKALAAQRQEL